MQPTVATLISADIPKGQLVTAPAASGDVCIPVVFRRGRGQEFSILEFVKENINTHKKKMRLVPAVQVSANPREMRHKRVNGAVHPARLCDCDDGALQKSFDVAGGNVELRVSVQPQLAVSICITILINPGVEIRRSGANRQTPPPRKRDLTKGAPKSCRGFEHTRCRRAIAAPSHSLHAVGTPASPPSPHPTGGRRCRRIPVSPQ